MGKLRDGCNNPITDFITVAFVINGNASGGITADKSEGRL